MIRSILKKIKILYRYGKLSESKKVLIYIDEYNHVVDRIFLHNPKLKLEDLEYASKEASRICLQKYDFRLTMKEVDDILKK